MLTPSTPTSPGRPASDTYRIDPPTSGSVLSGLAVAVVLQIVAAAAATISLAIVLAAAFANFGNYGETPESTWWVIFAAPLAIVAVAIYVLSGFAASRVMRTGLGWMTLLIPPLLVLLPVAASAAR